MKLSIKHLPNGISSEILTSLGAKLVTRDRRPAISLPTMRGYQNRVIFLDGKHKKYKWEEKDQPHPPLFWAVPEGTKLAVVTNGEKATLVLAQQGIPSCNTFGEGNELERAIAALQAAGVTSLIVVPDCDKAGIIAAQKWRDMGAAAGLEIAILDLGAYLSRAYFMQPEEYHKWDLRDLWLLLEQDSELFKEVLYKQIPHLNFEHYQAWLPDTTHQPFRPQSKEGRDSASLSEIQKLYDEWWNKVLAAVSATAPRGDIHKHQHCRNPHHADKNPSFRITKDLAPICTCTEARKRDNIAAWFNVISWKDFLKERLKERREKRKEISRSPAIRKKRRKYDGLRMLPAALKKAMIKDGLTNLCRIIDTLLYNATPLGTAFTRQELIRMMEDYGLKKSGIYRATIRLSQNLRTVLVGEIEHANFGNGSDYAVYYSLDSLLPALEKHYGYSIVPSGDPPENYAAILSSARLYRQYALLENMPYVETNLSLKEIGEDFGLSAGTIGNYARELRDQGLIAITPHYKYRELSADDFSRLSLVLGEWKATFSNSYIEMYSVNDGVRTPHNHKGGKRKIPNNRIPALYSAVMFFFEKSLNRNIIKSVKSEQSNLAFVLVSKLCNSYRRLPVPVMKNPMLNRLMEGIAA